MSSAPAPAAGGATEMHNDKANELSNFSVRTSEPLASDHTRTDLSQEPLMT